MVFSVHALYFSFSFNGLIFILNIIIPILCLLIVTAYYTLLERKVMARIQRREGPNSVGFAGFLQPLADGFKLLINEVIMPVYVSRFLFKFAPVLALFLGLFIWFGFVFSRNFSFLDLQLSILYYFIISSFGVYSVILAGWSSNSKYAFLGAIRSSAQMVSYEVAFGFILILIGVYSSSLNTTDIILAQKNNFFFFALTPLFLIFCVAIIAETNRAPFDLPEAESEIVAGYHIEYGSIPFSLFFLGEYLMMLFMSGLAVTFFLGGWFFSFLNLIISDTFIFGFKIVFFSYIFLILRAALPRYRYDFLMNLGWLVFLPLTFAALFFYVSLIYLFNLNTCFGELFIYDAYRIL